MQGPDAYGIIVALLMLTCYCHEHALIFYAQMAFLTGNVYSYLKL